VAICVLVLQSFLSVWATAAMTAPMLDAFGNPLCITSIEHNGTPPPGGHSTLPDCCTLGCNMPSHLLAADPSGDTGLRWLLSSDDIHFDLAQSFQIDGPEHNPGSPRASPLTA